MRRDPERSPMMRDLLCQADDMVEQGIGMPDHIGKAFLDRLCYRAARQFDRPMPPETIYLTDCGRYTTTNKSELNEILEEEIPLFRHWEVLMRLDGPWVRAIGSDRAVMVVHLLASPTSRETCLRMLKLLAPGEVEQNENERKRSALKAAKALGYMARTARLPEVSVVQIAAEEGPTSSRQSPQIDVDSEFFAGTGAAK